MKSSILAASLTVLLLAACNKKVETTNPETPPEPPKAEPTPTPKKVVVEKPVVKIEEAPAKVEAPAPPPKRLAPEGTLYTTERITVTTDDGVHSVPPGTKLALVRKTATGLLVKTDRAELTVRPEQVTNDLDVAARASGLSAQSTAVQSAADQARAAVGKAQMQEAENQNAASIQAAVAVKTVQQLQARQALLVREKADLQTRLQKNEETAQRRSYAKIVLGRDSTAVTVPPAEVAKWRARLVQIDVDLREVETRINTSR
jgi:hypothetical protein